MGILSDVGGAIGIRFQALPQSAADGEITGAAIDRLGIGSCVVAHASGAATGTPDSYTVETVLEHSHTDVAEDFEASGISVAALAGDDESAYADVNLGPLRRYIRTVTTVTFTGGTDPETPVTVVLVLGGSAAGAIA